MSEKRFALISNPKCAPCQRLKQALSEDRYAELNNYVSIPEENSSSWTYLVKMAGVRRVPALVDTSTEKIVSSGFNDIMLHLIKFHENASNTQTPS